MSSEVVKECRLCKSRSLSPILDFGSIPLGNNLLDNLQDALCADKYPLGVIRCNDCHHFQLSFSVDPKILYATNYTYLSAIGESFSIHQDEYCRWLDSKIGNLEDKLIFEIGSNDGSLLKKFKKNGARVCGVDPAGLAADAAKREGIATYNEFYSQETNNRILSEFGNPDLVVSQNVLAHVDDLVSVFKNIFQVLRFGGYFSFEIGYFKSVLENNLFDTIYHEHLDYHHAAPLKQILNQIGFSLLHFSTYPVQGGSLRILAKKTQTIENADSVNSFLDEEKKSILYDDEFLQSWHRKISTNMSEVATILRKNHQENKLVVGYGSPTKAVLLLKMLNIGKDEIKYTIEDNQLKVGKFLSSSGIQIKSFDSLILDNEVEVIFIFAWNFADDIIKKIRNIGLKNVKIIVPLPKLKVISL